jgi:hypothetical protein
MAKKATKPKTAVSSTASVCSTNVMVVADAPAMAMGTLYQSLAHSTGLMFENAVNSQHQSNIVAQAATMQGVIQINSVDTISDAIAVAIMIKAENKAKSSDS